MKIMIAKSAPGSQGPPSIIFVTQAARGLPGEKGGRGDIFLGSGCGPASLRPSGTAPAAAAFLHPFGPGLRRKRGGPKWPGSSSGM